MDSEQIKVEPQLPCQQLFVAVQERSNVTYCQQDGRSPQKTKVAHQHQVGMPSKPPQTAQGALLASEAGIIPSLPNRLPNAKPRGITASVPKCGTVEEALQLLLQTTKLLMEEFVQSCKLVSQGTHRNLQQSSMNIAKSLERFDRRELHLIAHGDITQVASGINTELELQGQNIRSLSQQVQDSWEALHERSSAVTLGTVARLHDGAHVSIDTIQSEISSHLLRFNQTALANKRAMHSLISGLKTVSIKIKKKTMQELQAGLDDWRWLVTENKIQNLAHEICQPEFMRHDQFVTAVVRLRHLQRDCAAKVLEGITTTLLLPSAVHTVAVAKKAFSSIQDICCTWKHEIRSGVESLWQQHKSQTQSCHLLCTSVRNWCTENSGFTQGEISGMFEAKCSNLLDAARVGEEHLIQYVCTNLEAQHQKWSGMLTILWLNFIKICATTHEAHTQECEAAFVESQSAFSDLLAEHRKDIEGKETSYQELLQKISCAPSEEDLTQFTSEAAQHLDTMLQGYHSSHHQLMNFVQDRGSTLMSLHDKHRARICNILGIAPACAETSVAGSKHDDDQGETGESILTSITQNDAVLRAVGMSSEPEMQHANPQLPNYSICSVQYVSLKDLVPMLLSISLGQQTKNIHTTETETLENVTVCDADNRTTTGAQSLDTDQVLDSPKHVDIWKLVTSEVQAILCDLQVELPEAALRTSVHVFIQRIMEHVIKHQTEATNSVEVWKTQCATYLTARLDQLLQHHRPKIGVMEETWCENARLTLKGMRNVLAQFLQKQTAAISSQVEDFDKQVERATIESERNLAHLKSISHEFQGSCSVKAVEMCERKLTATFTAAQQEIKTMFQSVEHSSMQILGRAITSCNGFLGDVSLVSTGFERAACAPEKVQTLVSSIHRVKQSQQRIVEAASSSMVAGVCTAYASIQSRISRFRLDAAFVERTEKITDDMNRGFGNNLEESRKSCMEIHGLLQKLQSCMTAVNKQKTAGAETAAMHDKLLSISNCLRQHLFFRSKALEVLKSSNLALDTPTPLVLLASSDPLQEDRSEDRLLEATEKSESSICQELPICHRIKSVLDVARTSMETAATEYYAHADDTPLTLRSDILTNKQNFLTQQEKSLELLSQQCEQHVEEERRTFRAQVLSAHKALHALPDVLCSVHVAFGVEAIQQRTEQEILKYTDSMLKLESGRLLHQQRLSQVMMIDSRAQLEILTQKEQERQSACGKLCVETISAMRSAIVACTNNTLKEMAQMCLAVSDFLTCWVLPSDLTSEDDMIEHISTEVSPFEYLAQIQSIMDTSNVEVLSDRIGRSIRAMKWKASMPLITPETGDQKSDVGHEASTTADAEVGAVTITSLDTPPHWLLIRAHEQASDMLASYHRRSIALAVSHVHCVQKTEQLWRGTWDEMVADIRVRNKYA